MRLHLISGIILISSIVAATPYLHGHTKLRPSQDLIASPQIQAESERFHLPSILELTTASNSVPKRLAFFDLESGELALQEQKAPNTAPIIGYHAPSGRLLTLTRDSKLEVHQEGHDPIQIDLGASRGTVTLLADGDRIFLSGARSFGPTEEKSLLFSISQDTAIWEELGSFELSPDQSRAVEIEPFSYTTSFGSGISSIKAIDARNGFPISEIDLATPYPTNTLQLAAQSSDQGYLLLYGILASNANQPTEQIPSILIVNTSNGTYHEIPNSEYLSPYFPNTFSPSGSSIALWDINSESIKIIQSADGNERFTKNVSAPFSAFSSDEQTVYLPAQQTGSIEALNAETGQLIRSYSLPSTEGIDSLSASPDGKLLAAVAGAKAFQIDLQTGDVVSFPVLDISYRGIKFSPDSNYWILSSLVGEIISVPSASPLNRSQLTSPPAELLIGSPNKGSLTYISPANYLVERHLSNAGLSLTRLASEGSNSSQILAHSQTSLLVRRTTRLENGYIESIHIVDSSTGQSQWEPPINSTSLVSSAVGPIGETVCAIERVNPFQVFDTSNRLVAYRKAEDAAVLNRDNSEGNFASVSISPDGTLITALQYDSNSSTRPRLFRSADGSEISLPETSGHNWGEARFGPESKHLYLLPASNQLGRINYQITVIDLEANDTTENVSLYGYVPSSLLDISQDGHYLLALSREKQLILIDLEQGKVADETEINWTPNNVYFSNFGPAPEQALFEEDSRSFLFRDEIGSLRRWYVLPFSPVSAHLENRAGQRLIKYPRTPESSYLLEYSNNLSDWEVTQEFEGNNDPIEFPLTPPSGPEPEFYRLWKSDPPPRSE